MNTSHSDKTPEEKVKSLLMENSILIGGYFQLQKTLKQLEEVKEKFAVAFETSPYGIVISKRSDSTIVEVNSTIIAATGYSRDEFINSSSIALKLWVNPTDREKVVSHLINHSEILGEEYPFRRKNGAIMYGLYSAKEIYVGGVPMILSSILDVTEKKRAEQLAIQIKTRDEAILDSIGDAVYACDIFGTIVLFNKMAENLTGVPAREAIGKHYSDVVTFIRESNDEDNDVVEKAKKSDSIVTLTNDFLLVRKDGTKIPIADSAAPIKNESGVIMGCVVVFHDASVEHEIDRAKTEFVSLVSHQLRTPLSTINWYVEVLLSEDIGLLTPKQKKYSEEVYAASQRMVRLVNSILNVSRLELGTFSVNPELTDIKQLAQISINDLEVLSKEKNVSIASSFDTNLRPIMTDPKLFSMIIDNLLANGIKYSKEGSEVSLKIYIDTQNLLIEVADNGIGIPEHQQKNIFEKLFRADNAKVKDPSGTGLGLYIVKRIVSHSGGKIWFESQENTKTTFHVSLPLEGMKKKGGDKRLN